MNESRIVNELKRCKAVYISYNIFFYKVTQPCSFITNIDQEAYIGLLIDDSYFDNDDFGYHVHLEDELNSKRKTTIYGVFEDGSLLILECFKTSVSKSLFNNLDKTLTNNHHFFAYHLTEINGVKYTPNGQSIKIEDANKWVVKDKENHYFKDSAPALRYFRENINNYLLNSGAFIHDETICIDSEFSRILPTPLYKFFLEKKNRGSLTEEESLLLDNIESIFFTFAFNESIEDEDFLIFQVLEEVTKEEKHYVYEDVDYQIKISIQKDLFEIDYTNENSFIRLRTNALSTVYSKSYFFNSEIRFLEGDVGLEDYNLNISYDKA